MSCRLTPWFVAVTQPPVRVGWYECRNSPDREDQDGGRRYWNGKRWLERGPRSKPVGFGTVLLDNQWRGLIVKRLGRWTLAGA